MASPTGLPFSASLAASIRHRKVKIIIMSPTMMTLSADGVIKAFHPLSGAGRSIFGQRVRHISPVRVFM